MMQLHNTLHHKTEEFTPLHAKTVHMYSCGPTVYDHIHIGNLSSFIMADTLRRVLTSSGYQVKHVMNFTDVDDKTIARSQREYPDSDPRAGLLELTKHYSEIFLHDMGAIGNDISAITFIRATDPDIIAGMQKLITELYQQKFAYIADDGVYFSIAAYQNSGKTYGQLADITVENTSQQRISNDEYDKDHVHDFALWKRQATANEPAWEFELDGHQLLGRPGWHIECSVMSAATLGQPFDIHTGGIDLIFPHHENEIAQSTAGRDDPVYSRFFVHNEHLMVEGRKMSKSLQNFFTLRDVIEHNYEPLAFRLFVLQSQYHNQSNFSWENLAAAQNRLKNWQAMADQKWQAVEHGVIKEQIETTKTQVATALSDNLNTPQAFVAISALDDELAAKGLSHEAQHSFQSFLDYLDDVFGLDLAKREDIPSSVKGTIKDREAARDNKDWTQSDTLRDQLSEQGMGIRDTAQGPIWYRL